MRSIKSLLVLLVLAVGCGGDDEPAAPDATASVIDAAIPDAETIPPDAEPPDAVPPDAELPDAMPSDIYFEDFESGDGGYTHAGTADEWAHGTPSGAPIVNCNGGTGQCWGTDLTGDYDRNSNQELTSPVINVPDVPGTIKLSFAQSYEIEGGFFDWVTVGISIDGGTYTSLFTYTGAPTHEDWDVLEFPINEAKGKTLQIKWGLGSDGSTQYDGYFIDDVRVFAE